jgi:hypothetical protein
VSGTIVDLHAALSDGRAGDPAIFTSGETAADASLIRWMWHKSLFQCAVSIFFRDLPSRCWRFQHFDVSQSSSVYKKFLVRLNTQTHLISSYPGCQNLDWAGGKQPVDRAMEQVFQWLEGNPLARMKGKHVKLLPQQK